MKAKLILCSLIFVLSGFNSEAQILKKLKKKVANTTEKVLLKKTEEKTEQVVEGAIDGTVESETNPTSESSPGLEPKHKDPDANKAKLINTEAKRAFYTSDVIVRTSDSEGKGSDYYFDADEIAARGTAPQSNKPIFIDSEGFQYGYNDSEGRWEKTGLMRSDAMAFMMPMISMSTLKLPPEPTLDASEKLKNQGLNMNTFQIVEWAFIYKPEHFRNADYKETTAPCPDGGTCPKFLYTDPDYNGSWILFDSQDRLSEIYANVNTQQAKGDGTYKFTYEPVTVNIPNAVEVKMPFQDLFLSGADVESQGEEIEPGRANKTVNNTGNVDQSVESRSNNTQTIGETNNLASGYNFEWKYELKMEMSNRKQESMSMVVLLKENSNYQGIRFNDPKNTGLNEATMVFDMNLKQMLMFIDTGDNKIVQVQPIKETGETGEIGEFEITELSDKTIMGYLSKGLQIENDEFIVEVYHTTEAPIEMRNLFNFSGSMDMKLPDIDPRLVKQFSKGLVTQMRYTDKKKAKNNVLITGQSLNKVATTINRNEYQNMNFMGQLKSKGN